MMDPALASAANTTVVIVSYASAVRLEANLRRVHALLPYCEMILVENAGEAAAAELDHLCGDMATIVCSPGNVGFGAGCNIGARVATRDFLFFLNPDVAVLNIELDLLAREFAVAHMGILVATQRSGSGDVPLLQSDRAWRTDVLLWLFRYFAKPRALHLDPIERYFCRGELCAIGAAMFVRREEFFEVGGFDERFFLYFEDRDLSRRYHRASYPVGATSAVVVEHSSGTSTTVDKPLLLAYSFLSAIELAEIWEQSGLRAAKLVVRGLDWLSLLRHLPPNGPLSIPAQKGRQACRVRQALFRVSREQPPDKYPHARVALVRLGLRMSRSKVEGDVGAQARQ